MQDEISSANPSLQLLEQHGLGGLIPGGRNAAAQPPPPPLAAAGNNKGAKQEASPRANPVVNRRKHPHVNLPCTSLSFPLVVSLRHYY